MVELVTDIVEEGGLVQPGEGTRRGLYPPASEVQQVIAIGAQGARRKPTVVELSRCSHEATSARGFEFDSRTRCTEMAQNRTRGKVIPENRTRGRVMPQLTVLNCD